VKKEEEVGDEGIRGPICHTAQDPRPRTTDGNCRRGRKAGKYGRNFDSNGT
jgi:hypothetical protein